MPTRQGGRSAKNSRSTNTPPDDHRAISIDAVNLKHRLRNIDPDRANLAPGTVPLNVVAFRPNHPMALRCRRVGAVHHIRIDKTQGEHNESAFALKADLRADIH